MQDLHAMIKSFEKALDLSIKGDDQGKKMLIKLYANVN